MRKSTEEGKKADQKDGKTYVCGQTKQTLSKISRKELQSVWQKFMKYNGKEVHRMSIYFLTTQ